MIERDKAKPAIATPVAADGTETHRKGQESQHGSQSAVSTQSHEAIIYTGCHSFDLECPKPKSGYEEYAHRKFQTSCWHWFRKTEQVITQSRAYEVLNHARQYVLSGPWEIEVALKAIRVLKTCEYLLRLE